MGKITKHFWRYILTSAYILTGTMTAIHVQAQTCEGRICLKDGGRLLFTGENRIEMPRKKQDIEVYRNFFSHQCQRNVVKTDLVDSVVVWNADAPASARILVPIEDVGWCWRYIDHSKIQVYVYSSQGYSLNALGGITAHQGNTVAALFLIPSKTACDFYVSHQGGRHVCLGDVYKKCDKSFIHKLCSSVGIATDMEQILMKSGEVDRSSMIQRVVEILDEQEHGPNESQNGGYPEPQ